MVTLPAQVKWDDTTRDAGKVLIVDDDQDILFSLADLLEYQGNYVIFTAASANAAKEVVRNSAPDIALVDIKLGHDDGLELISALKEIHPDLICITMTAFRDPEQTPKAVRSGADDFIYKPIESTRLLQTLSSHLRHQNLVREKYETERRFRGVFDQTFQLLFLLEPDGTLIEANATALGFAGIDKSKIIGKQFWETPWWSSPIPGLATTGNQRIKQAVAEASLGEFIHYETVMRNHSGNMVPMDFSLKPIANDSGAVMILIAESRDLSQYKAAENALRESEMQVRLLLESTTEGICGIDTDGNCTFANSKCLELLGYTDIDELLGKQLHDLIHNPQTSDSAHHFQECQIYKPFLENRSSYADDELFWRKDGSGFPVEYRSDPIRRNDSIIGVVITFTDISERKEAEKNLLLAGMVTENAAEAILVMDNNWLIVNINPAFTLLTGFSKEEVIGKTPSLFVSEKNDSDLYEVIQSRLLKTGKWTGEIWHKRVHNDDFPVRASLNSAKDPSGEITHYIGLYTDISDIKKAEYRLEQLAHYDSLTELPNRALFQENLEMALSSARRHSRHMALLFIDLDRFKQVNDTLGHKFGDKVLIETAQRLREIVRTEDTVSRLSGDEFTIILCELDDPVFAGVIAQRIVESLSHPYNLFDEDVYISASVGIALYPDDGLDAEILLRNADLAMYHAKADGGNSYQLFNRKINARAREKHLLETGLRHAIEKEELHLLYQPKYNLNTKEIVGIEALLRWRHRQVGDIAPNKFMAIAEDTGLIIPIGQQCFIQACQQAKRWQQERLPDIPVAVNLSAKELWDKNLPKFIKATLEDAGLLPELLELEIKESTITDDFEKNLIILNQLKQIGVRITIDNFGTGSLAPRMLKQLPIDALKIDNRLLADACVDMDGKVIVWTIVSMAKNMGISICAEGVETQDHLKLLKQFDCDQGQGFLLGKPVSAEALFTNPTPGNKETEE